MHISLREKIAQMCIIGIGSKDDIEPVKRLIKSHAIGGVILYKNNYDTYKDMLTLVKSLKECNKDNKFPLFIAIDQEGGRVNRMPSKFYNLYNASKIAKTHNLDFLSSLGEQIGNMLIKTGINMDLAPVLDLQTQRDSQVIGDRAYSKNADLVAKYGLTVYKELKKKKVIGVVKHFPGHGAVQTNSHKFLPIIKRYDTVKASHLYPFIKAIQSGVDVIMVGHILIKDRTGWYPCTLSKRFLDEELRKRLNYKNLIMTDELSMRSIRYIYGRKRSIKLAFIAGNDLLCYKYYPGIEQDMIDRIVKLVKQGKISEKSVRDSFKRIVLLKEKYHLNNDTNYRGVNVNLTNYKIREFNKAVDNYLEGR